MFILFVSNLDPDRLAPMENHLDFYYDWKYMLVTGNSHVNSLEMGTCMSEVFKSTYHDKA